MSAINGRWILTSTENFIDFLKACGTAAPALEKAKNLEVTGPSGGKEEFQFDGTTMTRKIITKDDKVFLENSVKIGQESTGKTIDGREVKFKLTLNGNTFVREESGPGYTARWERTVNGNDMTLVMTAGGVTCTRKMQKI